MVVYLDCCRLKMENMRTFLTILFISFVVPSYGIISQISATVTPVPANPIAQRVVRLNTNAGQYIQVDLESYDCASYTVVANPALTFSSTPINIANTNVVTQIFWSTTSPGATTTLTLTAVGTSASQIGGTVRCWNGFVGTPVVSGVYSYTSTTTLNQASPLSCAILTPTSSNNLIT